MIFRALAKKIKSRLLASSPKRITKNLTSKNKEFFGDLYIHEKMLSDEVRMNAYRSAIRKYISRDSVVLDLGTGTGILSLFAAMENAKKVYAIDHSKIISLAKSIAEIGKYQNIEFIKCHSRSFVPEEKVDVIVHEQMGTFIDEEQMILNIVDLRRRVLRPGGKVLPNVIKVFAEPVQLTNSAYVPFLYQQKNFPAIDLGRIRDLLPLDDPRYRYHIVGPSEIECLLSDPEPLFAFDLETLQVDDLPKEFNYERTFIKAGRFDAICFFFQANFDDELFISTRPDLEEFPRNWRNVIFRHEGEVVEPGQTTRWELKIGDHRSRESWTWTRVP